MNSRFQKFLSYYRPHVKIFVLDMVCVLISAGVSLALPMVSRFITKQLTDGAFADALPRILWAGGGMLALILVYIVCNMTYDYQGHFMGAKMETTMRSELFAHYERLSFSFYDEQKIGRLMSVLSNDVLAMTELFHHGPEDLLMFLVKIVGAFVLLLHINLPLALAVFALMPFMTLFALRVNPKMRAAYKQPGADRGRQRPGGRFPVRDPGGSILCQRGN